MSLYMTRQIQKCVDIGFCKQTKHYLRNLYVTSLKNKQKFERKNYWLGLPLRKKLENDQEKNWLTLDFKMPWKAP